MTAHGRYASPDSSFGRSTGNAAARGGALIAVAVVIGFLLLWRGGVGGSDEGMTAGTADDAAADATDGTTDETTDDGTDDGSETPAGDDTTPADDATGDTTDDSTVDEPTETVPAVPTTRPPGEVKVAVANATDTSGLAGARSGDLSAFGYVTEAVNAAADTAQSNVYYVEGYGDDAAALAEALGGTSAVLRPMPDAGLASLIAESNQAAVEGFHVAVILGTDGVLG